MNPPPCQKLHTQYSRTFHGVPHDEERVQAVAKNLGLTPSGTAWKTKEGRNVYIKVQKRTHERPGDSTRGILTPALLEHGTSPDGSWWEVISLLDGTEPDTPTQQQARALGAALSRWHRDVPAQGLRLDDTTGLETWLGTALRLHPATWPALSAAAASAFHDLPMVAVHGDAAVTHNTLWNGQQLSGLIDPGAVAVAPAALDLAFAAARDIATSGIDTRKSLLGGYSHEVPGWDAALKVTAARTWLDCLVDNDPQGRERIRHWIGPELTEKLREQLPHLTS